ncbi:hypothetical protein [Alkalidesulfovibrio alkalitolerans]|uniref:hypothetical protein n=1 Tax=Alkalidesulfovibrio alkalitolerans TaxID=293256 RepID=UPI00058BA1DE|nr:hypothetical protein [Alkalidesulfovibrio alkalitolerans]
MLELVIWYLSGLLIWAVFTVLIYKSVCLRTQKKWPRRLALAIMILLPTWDVVLGAVLYKPACMLLAKEKYYGDCGELVGYDCSRFELVYNTEDVYSTCPYRSSRSTASVGLLFIAMDEYRDIRCDRVIGKRTNVFLREYFPMYLVPFFTWVAGGGGALLACLERDDHVTYSNIIQKRGGE